jgi:endonuclease/exonuclease/phosphatase family metal-dependent hydrolase
MYVPTLRRIVLAMAAVAVAAAPVAAQTLTLKDGSATTLRGGTYASTNYSGQQIVETRASDDASYVRRALLKFDTNTTLAAGTPIKSAILTITVGPKSNAQTRQLVAYHVTSSYDEAHATWKQRKSGLAWGAAGGDIAASYAVSTITGTPGSKVSFDVTALVAAVVRGDFGSSRYTRILLVDKGAPSRDSYKQIYSDEASDPSTRPTLTITAGTSSSGPGTTTTSTTAKTLRVLQWNTHHGGYGTDGRYDTNRLATWIVKMKPDVVMLNEIEKFTSWGNQNQPEVYKSLLQQKTGKTWYYIFAQEFGVWNANGKGNLILSTVPFTFTDRYKLVHNSDRSLAEASITWNGKKITLLLTHLDPDSQTLRLTQATEVTTFASAEPENRILTGDMNAWPDQTSIAQYDKLYKDSWAVAAANGNALAFSGNNGETKKGRIDYIFFSKNAANLTVLSSQVYDTRDSKGIMPSDHRPVLTAFSVK